MKDEECQWRDDDYDVLENGVIVGRIFKVSVAPADRPGPATTATSSALRTAMSRRARPRWPRSPSHGGGSDGLTQKSPASGCCCERGFELSPMGLLSKNHTHRLCLA